MTVAVPDPEVGAAVCAAFRTQVEKIGLSIGDDPVWADISFSETVDPFSQEVSVLGTWRGKERFGTVTFFPDGRIFGEYQVLLPHPKMADFYVETVQIWGTPEKLRGEAVLAEYAK